MKKIILIALVFPVTAFCQYKLSPGFLSYNKNAGTEELKKYTYENLRLYPIIARDSFQRVFKNVGKFTTLKQALDQKKIKITETGNGGTVNNVFAENISKDTIIIICGEVIKGGQQDRVINQDIVLYPKSGKKDISVFCVEHGRWSGNGSDAKPASFDGYYNFSTMSLRKVVEKDKNQGKVWDQVSKINAENKTSTSTGTYTALGQSKAYNSKLNSYLAFFKDKIKSEKGIVGVIVVSGTKVLGADIFATNDLFIKNFDNLLHSYATEAIVNGKPVSISQKVVDQYIANLLSNEKKQEETLKAKGSMFEHKGKRLRISSYE